MRFEGTKSIQSRLNSSIKNICRIPAALLFDEAETYICALCDMERKPCQIHTGIQCAMMISNATELEMLRIAEKSELNGEYPLCVSCGGEIPSSTLAKNPLTEVCPDCHTQPEENFK